MSDTLRKRSLRLHIDSVQSRALTLGVPMQAAVMAARLLSEQQAGNLGSYSGRFGQRGQIALYTFGAPRVGDATFAG